jgi:hypothetical protein
MSEAMDPRFVSVLLGLVAPTKSWTPQKMLAVSAIGDLPDWWTGETLGRRVGVSEGWGCALLTRLADDRVVTRYGRPRGIQWTELNPRWDRWGVEWRVSKHEVLDRLARHAELLSVSAGDRFRKRVSSRSMERGFEEILSILRERGDLDPDPESSRSQRARRSAVETERIRALRSAERHLHSVNSKERDDSGAGALGGDGPTTDADPRASASSATEEEEGSIRLPKNVWHRLVDAILARTMEGNGVYRTPRRQLLAACAEPPAGYGWERVLEVIEAVPKDVYRNPGGFMEEVVHVLALGDDVPDLPDPASVTPTTLECTCGANWWITNDDGTVSPCGCPRLAE